MSDSAPAATAIGRSILMALCGLPACASDRAADANAGRILFRQQCSLCHSANTGDDRGNQGPNLIGILGRPAAGDPKFGYSAALKSSGLTWDVATLTHFLMSPTTFGLERR